MAQLYATGSWLFGLGFAKLHKLLAAGLLRPLLLRNRVGLTRPPPLKPSIVGFCLIAFQCLINPTLANTTDGILTLSKFERLYVDSYSSPPDPSDGNWQSTQLKEFWWSERNQHLQAWYRTAFDLTDKPTETYAIYVPRISAVAEFWLNGVNIGRSARFTDPLPNAWNLPTYIAIPENLLNQNDNVLEIYYRAEQSRLGFLFEVSVGPSSAVLPNYQLAYFGKVTASKILTAVICLTVFAIAFLMYYQQQPPSYRWFMFGGISWAIYSLHLYWVYIPLPIRLWHCIYIVAQLSAAIFFTIAVHRMTTRKPVLLEVIFGIFIIVITLASAVVKPVNIIYVHSGVMLSCYCMVIYSGILLIQKGLQLRAQGGLWMAVAGTSIVLMSVGDIIIYGLELNLLNFYPFIPVIAVVSGSLMFFIRFVQTDKAYALLKLNSDNRTQTAVEAERERLKRDIHDGIGGQLASTLSLLEKDQQNNQYIIDTLKNSLLDLRMIISSLETMGQEGNIVSLLATLRERMEHDLNQHGITLDWAVEPLPSLQCFGSSESLQLMRVVQEALTNILKHSEATVIRFSCGESNGNEAEKATPGVYIKIENDDTKKPSFNSSSGGYGLTNMRHRTESLGGQFEFAQYDQGACVCLWIPLNRTPKQDSSTGFSIPG